MDEKRPMQPPPSRQFMKFWLDLILSIAASVDEAIARLSAPWSLRESAMSLWSTDHVAKLSRTCTSIWRYLGGLLPLLASPKVADRPAMPPIGTVTRRLRPSQSLIFETSAMNGCSSLK